MRSRRAQVSVNDRRTLASFRDDVSRAFVELEKSQRNDSRSETLDDLKVRLRKLKQATRSLAAHGKIWNPDRDVFEAVDLRRQLAIHDLRNIRTFRRSEKRIQTERLWILSAVSHRLETGDRFLAVSKCLKRRHWNVESAAISQRVRRFTEKQPRELRRAVLWGILLSHFSPPSAKNYRGEKIPLKLLDGTWVFAGIKEEEIDLLKRLLMGEQNQSSSSSTICSAISSASSRVSSSSPVIAASNSPRTNSLSSARQVESE